MTATVAAVAGGGLALAFHDSSSPPKDCGLVPCAAALPAAIRTSAAWPASPPATAAPTAVQRASTPPSPAPAPSATAPEAAAPVPSAGPTTGLTSPTVPVSAEPVSRPQHFSSSAPAVSSARQAVSPGHAIGVGYEITRDGHHGIHGQIVIANESSAPVSGWRVTVVLPGDSRYQALNARNRSDGSALVMVPPAGQALAGGSIELIAFTARGTTSTPVRFTFTDSARRRPSGRGGAGAPGPATSRTAGGQPGSGRRGHDGWPFSWLGGWRHRHPPNGGWLTGGWPGQDGRGGGWSEGGRAGQHHGWPGGR